MSIHVYCIVYVRMVDGYGYQCSKTKLNGWMMIHSGVDLER
jgi:hypothetical protein